MNIEYIGQKDKVLVSNHHGILHKREYQDNIEDVLIQENKIEKIEDELYLSRDTYSNYLMNINEFEKEIKIINIKNSRIKKNIKKGCTYLFFFLYAFIVIAPYLFGTLNILNVIIALLGSISFILINQISSILLDNNSKMVALKEKKDDLDSEFKNVIDYIEFLSTLLSQERTKLEKLIYNKEINEKQKRKLQNKIIKVDDYDILKQQKAYLKLMKDCGCHEQIWIRYFQGNQLFETLESEYGSDEASLMCDYIEENVVPKRSLEKKDSELF